MDKQGRGMKCLNLAHKKKLFRKLPKSLPRPTFTSARGKVEKFLSKLKTQKELRKMSDSELKNLENENMYSSDEHEEITENEFEIMLSSIAANESLPHKTPNQRENISGHISFGNLGFFSMENNEDMNKNCSAENEDNIDVNLNVSSESNLADLPEDSDEVDIRQIENESTPANNKSKNDKAVKVVEKKRSCKSLKAVRANVSENIRAGKNSKKSKEAAKKGFKRNFLTVKFKLSGIQLKSGTIPDFALFVKDNVHEKTATNSAKHAEKYLSFVKGEIGERFYSEKGISYDPKDFFICENDVDLEEDKITPFTQKSKKTLARNIKVVQMSVEDSETTSEIESDEDIATDVFNMKKVAKKVHCPGSFIAPERQQSEDSESSGDVNIYGAAVDKKIDQKKKQRQLENKKRSKESADRTGTDILDSVTVDSCNTSSKKSKGIREIVNRRKLKLRKK